MRPPAPHRPLLCLAALAALASCSSSPSNPLLNPPPVAQAVLLTNFADCTALDQAIVDTVIVQMKSQLQMIEQGYFFPIGIEGGGVPANASNAGGPSA